MRSTVRNVYLYQIEVNRRVSLLKDESIHIQSVKVKVLTDEFEVKPFLDFDRYVDTIVGMVKGSEPNFSIGIYGE
jgi:hypothetical protein